MFLINSAFVGNVSFSLARITHTGESEIIKNPYILSEREQHIKAREETCRIAIDKEAYSVLELLNVNTNHKRIKQMMFQA
jgi:hypothetical protein